MEAGDLVGLTLVALAAGLAGGLLGVGGGVILVPGLVIFQDLTQVAAEATSLVAIVPLAVVGVARQRGYGNLRLKDGLLIGVLSPVGVVAGTVLANNLPERGLELLFAATQLFFAARLGQRALRPPPDEGDDG